MRTSTRPQSVRTPTLITAALFVLAGCSVALAAEKPVDITMFPQAVVAGEMQTVVYQEQPQDIHITDYPEGECTWWVAKRILETTGQIWPYWPDHKEKNRHANQQEKLADQYGQKRGNVPAPYAMAVMHRAPFLGGYGHVMFVEEVYSDGTFLASQYNWPNYHQQGPTEVLDTYGVTFIYSDGYEPTQEMIDAYNFSSAARLDVYFASIGSPLEGQGSTILSKVQKYNIKQAALWIGKMKGESQYCKDFAKPIEVNYYNCSGIKSKEILTTKSPDANGSWLRRFSSYDEYFDYSADLWVRAYDNLSEEQIMRKWVGWNNWSWLATARAEKKKIEKLL